MILLWLTACGLLSSGSGVVPTPPMVDGQPWLAPDAPALPTAWVCAGERPTPECFQAVPGATYQAGAQATDPTAPGFDPEAQPDEGPVRTVQVAPFFLQRHEVSASSYRLCVQEGPCSPPPDRSDGTWDHPARREAPITYVTWDEAKTYCAWRGARLPTEDEWGLAARGVEGRRWPWGDDPGCGTRERQGNTWSVEMVRTDCGSDEPVAPAALAGATPEGIEAMAGNAWEWTADAWSDGDPRRVQRGGGWLDTDVSSLRTTVRVGMPPDARLADVGFRCAWSR